MFHLAYFSNATRRLTPEELEEILKISRINNQTNGVTGILLYLDSCFLQILEGRKEAVMQTYSRIHKDPRHYDVLTLFEGETNERIFKDWSMGFQTMSIERYKAIAGFEDISNDNFIANVIKKSHPKIIKTLSIFYQNG